jgi:hypothetical protein
MEPVILIVDDNLQVLQPVEMNVRYKYGDR